MIETYTNRVKRAKLFVSLFIGIFIVIGVSAMALVIVDTLELLWGLLINLISMAIVVYLYYLYTTNKLSYN